ncbi:MAG: intein-containing adenosylcobalamin-dependent ribonucleoside-diphosphate reductase [Planctomycetes bacterium]|nr:intein-containing adenosylcobalamin-dependent ribonucleoside-diphosphate reductase [Planctomycetota bacterium]
MSETKATQRTPNVRDGSTASLAGMKQFHGRMKFDAIFCPTEVASPFDTVEWETRTSAIKGEDGEVLFEQTNCEVPTTWSQLATNVICSKYFYGEVGTDEREYSVQQLVHRVVRTITDWGLEDGYFASADDGERFYRDLAWLCLHQHGAFNSPVWFNVGLFHQYGVKGDKCNWRWDPTTQDVVQPENPYEFPQGSACFIQHVEDNMEDIMELARSEAMLFKFGSGTGTDLSTLRSFREKLAGGGNPSGPLSFMRVYDQIAAVVKSGGKTRRAAKMQSLKVWHPDVMEFIECKWKEEQKAHVLIQKGGYEANFNGEAYSSIMFQNANLSVRLTDDFMQALEKDEDWTTRWVTDPTKDGPTYRAREVMNRMADCAWHCGDPGVQYDTTINNWHTCPNSGRINASNPCVTGDTLVATAEGYRRIEDLVGQEIEVINGQGNKSPVNRVFKTGRKPIYHLKTRAGYNVRLTADHRVWTENRGDVSACDLTTDDVVRLEQPGFGNAFVPEHFGELVGAALGDGCVTRGANEQEFLFVTLGEHETLVAERLRRGIEQCKAWLDEGDARSTRPTNITSTATGLRVGTSVASVLAQARQLAVLDAGSTGKRLTDDVFLLDRPSQAAILRGLFTADGTVANYGDKSQYVSLDSTSRELLDQVQLLLLGFGIKSKLYENRRALDQDTALLPDGKGGSKAYTVQQMHSLRISRSSRFVFEQEIGFLPGSEKVERLAKLNAEVRAYNDPMTDRVASLAACGEADVYDLTEPVTSHFVANGMVVHNCSEYMFLDDTACNLASVNLMKFRQEDGSFDHTRYASACRAFFTAQEILVDHASYPTPDIARNSHKFRPLGLGFANLGSLLMSNGMAYDSDAGRGVCGAITSIMHGTANLTSAELAEAVGTFDQYEPNHEPFMNVMRMHRNAIEEIVPECPDYMVDAARNVWDQVLSAGQVHGFRNAQSTVLAPTGTISFMMDCDTTGIEPDIALVKYKQLAGGGMLKIVNQTVPLALETLGYEAAQIESILEFIEQNDTIEGAEDLKDEHLPVFDCAFTARNGSRSIAWKAHITMMAAAQPFLSGAISKTVNMPRDTTPKEIAEAYVDGWKLGLKALAIYRDGSKDSQPLNTSTEADQANDKAAALAAGKPRRDRLPDTRQSLTHKFSVSGHEGYITVGLFDDGRPGELFITMAKEGSTIGGLMNAFGTAVSMSLQYGVPLEDYVRKFTHMRFEPQGFTKNPDIRIAKSLIDYIFRWLGITFLPGYREASMGITPGGDRSGSDGPSAGGDDGDGIDGKGEPKPAAPVSSRKTGASGQTAGQDQAKLTTSATTNGHTNGATKVATNGHSDNLLERAGVKFEPAAASSAGGGRSEQFAGFQTDAPSCDGCGSITVRNGNCYLCHNCGNSMGCS